ncbi:uncharacterized protein BP01DRAFT_385907 [Aspergillus saccharolyticus JOP 1030-1]|uniref:Uncharacterized protein n=1 Tax=Aspergillus saccharolyticus JOP 1030-1 TaxID=1450539 RepID=A0A318Z405_9EURO|nr:hypothetical protein BP01DRAFT_385907 [Aspergillus saccharolyticus JOP 1030-1]PYH42061.1 hypothetical protein BP01DRAFT_385907 [Aspergillus saccharolyticus JOP 1030-1]
MVSPSSPRLVWGRDRFHPGEFYTGWLSEPIAITAIVFLAFAIVLSMFPTEGPNPTPANLNYTLVINGARVAWGAVLLCCLRSQGVKGPQATVKGTLSPSETRLPHEEEEREK